MTNQSQSPLIFKALAQCVVDIGQIGVGKDAQNSYQKFSYRSIDGTLQAFNRVFARNGVFMTTNILEQKLTKDGAVFQLDLFLEYTFYATDGSSVKGQTFCSNNGKDASKLTGQITSYALKEYLFKNFCVPVEGADDIDARDSNGIPLSVVPKVLPYQSWNRPEDAFTWAKGVLPRATDEELSDIIQSASPDENGSRKKSFYEIILTKAST